VRITVLGKSPSWPDADGACSGYLVEAEGVVLLVDCGPGVFAKLRAVRDYLDVDAVVISHLHADHFLDLLVFANGLAYSPRAGGARPLLLVPPGGRDALRGLCSVGGMRAEHIEAAFSVREYDPAGTEAAGPLRLRFCPVPHYVPANAVEVTAPGGGRFVYGADTGPCERLADFAAGADVLMLEATLVEPDEGPDRGHLTAAEAGEHARRAGAGLLVLTHRSDELDAGAALEQARAAFGGPVEVARAGAAYAV
jgi:ribonuclease BN (tRNA processing enzyme)